MIFFIIGTIFLLISIWSFWSYKKALGKYQEILITPTSKIKDVLESYQAVFDSLGPGNFNQYVEIKGQMVCDEILVSELAEEECVYFTSSIEREYEEEEWVTNSEGDEELRHHRGRETLSSHKDSIQFYVNDNTGKMKIDPKDSEIDLIPSIQKFIRQGSYATSQFVYGLVQIDISHFDYDETLGFHISEKIFPINRSIYVLGRATDENGELEITLPKEKGQRFIISYKSESKLIEETKKSSQSFKLGGIICLLATLGCILFGFFSGI